LSAPVPWGFSGWGPALALLTPVRPATVVFNWNVCLVKGLSAGTHTFSIWSTTGCGSNYFGWNRGQNLLLVEEMP
jgi:hypothetical protein